MTKEKFITAWDDMDDEMRVRWLAKIKDNQNNPEYEIRIDNDEVYLIFMDEIDMDEPTVLSFDNFGYHLIPFIFTAIGIKSDLV